MNNLNLKKEFSIGRSQVFRNEILAHLGRMITEERRQRNLRLAVLAEEIGVRIELLERLELGRAPINWECLRRVMVFFNKHVAIRLEDMV